MTATSIDTINEIFNSFWNEKRKAQFVEYTVANRHAFWVMLALGQEAADAYLDGEIERIYGKQNDK